MRFPLRRHVPTAVLTLAIAAASHAPAFADPVCETRNAPASTIAPAMVEFPVAAYTMQLFGTTAVQVDLDPSGSILNASVLKTSGTPLLDRAAIEATRESTFRPEIRDCVPVGGSYVYIVDFPKD